LYSIGEGVVVGVYSPIVCIFDIRLFPCLFSRASPQTYDKEETFSCKLYESIILGFCAGKPIKIPAPKILYFIISQVLQPFEIEMYARELSSMSQTGK
jgi:hypothetical protein